MEINFKNEVEKRKEQFLADLIGLLKLNTELDKFDPKNKKYPFGENIYKALEYMEGLAKRDGFQFRNVDGYMGEITYGTQKPFFASIGHMDVVPATGDWKYPAYQPTLEDGKLYARGVLDDKGPSIAVYYAIKILKESGIKLSKRIKYLISLDEESGMRDANYYFEKNPEVADSAFIADSNFPVVFAEKGLRPATINLKEEIKGFEKIQGGIRLNMIPDNLNATYTDLANKDILIKGLKKYFDGKDLTLDFKEEKGKLEIHVGGHSAHGSRPQQGVNAVTHFFKGLESIKELPYKDLKVVKLIANVFHEDHYGEKTGIANEHPEMGKTSLNLSPYEYKNGSTQFTLDIRYAKGIEAEQIDKALNKVVESHGGKVTYSRDEPVHYVNPKGEFVSKLVKIYQEHTGDLESQPMSIGGGTYAKYFENGVAYGPQRPGRVSLVHQPNEFAFVEDLYTAVEIYTHAIYELCK
jgi:succinyl-diaminopimelate desuccinylase